jgi:hypothetical protein
VLSTAAILYVGGAVGCEMLGSFLATTIGFESIPYLLATTLEESLEMAGAITFIYGFGEYAESQNSTLNISWGGDAANHDAAHVDSSELTLQV